MEPLLIIVIALGVVTLGLIIAVIFLGYKLADKSGRTAKADNVKVVDGVRYTTDKLETAGDGSVAVTHRLGDVLLERGVEYTVKKGGNIIPGKYTVLSGNENAESFNLRVGGFVREFKHASDIVLAEGEVICAVSHPVILR